MAKNLIAAIDVGSHAIRMKIGEINKAGEFRELESFRRMVALGHDTFTSERIGFDSVEQTCEILSDFKRTMDDYGVKNYRAMATTAIREADNRDYILDQIKIKTGFKLDVIDNSEEQFLTLKAIKYHCDDFYKYIREGAVVVVVGAGSIQITTYYQGELISSQNVKMGALRIREILGTIEDRSLRYYRLLDEYIHVNFEGLDVFEDDREYPHLLVVGGEISVVSNLLEMRHKKVEGRIKKKDFHELLDELKQLSTEEIKTNYDIKRERAEILVPSMLLFWQFIERTTSKEIVIPNATLTDGIIRYIHEDLYNLRVDAVTIEDMITNARVLARQFNYNEAHSLYVEKNALFFFDRLKKVHGLKEERVLLHVACVLHDIGKFISLDAHSIHSYDLIRSLEVFGMSRLEMEMIANIAKYHGMGIPKDSHASFAKLPTKQRIIVSKLIAMIRMADALDRSHQQKIDITSVKLKDGLLLVKGKSNENTMLEEWNFKLKSGFFKEVFGIEPSLRVSRNL